MAREVYVIRWTTKGATRYLSDDSLPDSQTWDADVDLAKLFRNRAAAQEFLDDPTVGPRAKSQFAVVPLSDCA